MKLYNDTYPDNWFEDYPQEPIGGNNPYNRCIYCKNSVPSINYRLEGHTNWCNYRISKETELIKHIKNNKSVVKILKFKPYPHQIKQ